MRSIYGLLFALCLVGARAEETATLEFKFPEPVKEEKVTMEVTLRQLKAAMMRVAKPPGYDSLNFARTYVEAARRANGAELKQLEGMLRALPVGALYFEDCFSAYATAILRQRVGQLATKPMRLEWKPSAETIPKEFADAPASLRYAWELHRAVVAPYAAVVLPPERADTPRTKTPPLEVDLRRVVGKPQSGAWKHLALQVWGFWCATGSNSLYYPRNRALLLSFLADGKMHEAAGAALVSATTSNPTGDEDPFESALIDLLTSLGLDWEQVMLGSLLPISGHNAANGRAVVNSSSADGDAWRLLATRGSERVVRQCLELIRWAKLDPRNAGEFLAGALGPDPHAVPSTMDIRPVRSAALSQECRGEVVAVLAEYLAPTNNPADLVDAMKMIPSHDIKEVRNPLSMLLSHRVHAVAANALGLLKKAGLATGAEAIAPATPPLRFRLLLDGKPLAGAKVSVDALAKRAPGGEGNSATPLAADVTVVINTPPTDEDQPFSRAVAANQELTTDGNGEIEFSLEDCLEPERIATMQFRMGPPAYSSEGFDDDLSEATRGLPGDEGVAPIHEWPGPWIVHRAEVVAGDRNLRDVDLRSADLEVKLAAFPGITPEKPIQIILQRHNGQSPFSSELGVVKIPGKVGGSAFFRRLQPGKYLLIVKAPGAARYESGEITVGNAPVVHQVTLEPGRNVRGTVIFPDGTVLNLVDFAQLLRDDVEIPRSGFDEWKALPFGHYTARILSTREAEEEATSKGYPMSRVAKEDRIGGRKIRFVINASTPATLNLGKIAIPREKR